MASVSQAIKKLGSEVGEEVLDLLQSAVGKSSKELTEAESQALKKYLPGLSKEQQKQALEAVPPLSPPSAVATKADDSANLPATRGTTEVEPAIETEPIRAREARFKRLTAPSELAKQKSKGTTEVEPVVETGPIGAREYRLKKLNAPAKPAKRDSRGRLVESPKPATTTEAPTEYIQKRDSRGRPLAKPAAVGAAAAAAVGTTAALVSQEKPPEVPEPTTEARVTSGTSGLQLTGPETKVYGALTGKKDVASGERPTTKDLNKGIEAAGSSSAIDTIPDKEDRDWYVERLNVLAEQRTEAYKLYEQGLKQAEDEKERRQMVLAFGKILDSIGQNLVKIGAANYGLKRGVDMSGVTFDKGNWDESFQAAQETFDNRVKALGAIVQEKEKSIRGLEEEAGKLKRLEEEQAAIDERARLERQWKDGQRIAKEKFEAEQNRQDRELKRFQFQAKNADKMKTADVATLRKNIAYSKREKSKRIRSLQSRLQAIVKAQGIADKDLDQAVNMLPLSLISAGKFESAKEAAGFWSRDKTTFQELTDVEAEKLRQEIELLEAGIDDLDFTEENLDVVLEQKLKTINEAPAATDGTVTANLPKSEQSGKIQIGSADELPDL